MNLTRCEFNHYYDADKYSECPHCKKETAISKMKNRMEEK